MDSLNRDAFFGKLRERLTELGVDGENIDKYIRQFERYFNTMTDEEASEQIQSFRGVDGIAKNIVSLIKRKQEAENRASGTVAEDDTPTITYKAVKAGNKADDTPEKDDRATRTIDSVSDSPSQPIENEEDDENNEDDENSFEDETDEDADGIEDTEESYTDGGEDEATADEADEDDEAVYFEEPPKPERTRQTSPQALEATRVIKLKRTPERVVTPAKANAIGQPKLEPEQRFSEVSRQSAPQPRRKTPRFDESIPQVNFNELDSDPDYEEKIPNTVLFWALFVITLPITAPIMLSVLLIFAAVFAALAVSIFALVLALIGIIIAGTALSLTGVIYGITVTFNTLPAGLFEIGLGIVIGGVAMLVGILIYNFAVRLLPLCIRYLSVFFGFVMRKIKELFRLVKKECAKQ